MNLDSIGGQTAIGCFTGAFTYKLNQPRRYGAQVILGAAAGGDRDTHFGHNLFKLMLNIYDFTHHFYIEVISSAEIFPVLCIPLFYKRTEQIEVTDKITGGVAEMVMGVAGLKFISWGKEKGGVGREKGACNKHFLQHIMVPLNSLYNHTGEAGDEGKLHHHSAGFSKLTILVYCIKEKKCFNSTDDSLRTGG